MKLGNLIFAFSFLLLISCSTPKDNISKPLTKAQTLLNETLNAHGGKRYHNANYEFTFRGNVYTFKHNHSDFEYSVLKKSNDEETLDQLKNQTFTRMVNKEVVSLSEKDQDRYSNSLNSVIYFATLPYKLQDPAVNLEHKGSTSIKGKNYQILQVSFDEEGGGKDHDDIYFYWINNETKRIDYLAYNFTVNNGGVRFRSAFNTRVVDGIVFQDYVNYKAENGTALDKLPALFEQDQLKKLSLIETEGVRSRN